MQQKREVDQWYFGMKMHLSVEKDSGLFHSVFNTAAKAMPSRRQLSCCMARRKRSTPMRGIKGIAKRPKMACKAAQFRIAMHPGIQRALLDTPDGRLQDPVDIAKAHRRAKGEHSFRVINQQFGLQKTGLRCMVHNRYNVKTLAAATNLCS